MRLKPGDLQTVIWRELVRQSVRRKLKYQSIGGTSGSGGWTTTYKVAKGHGQEPWVTVKTGLDRQGLYIECSCEIGKREVPCVHSARVLERGYEEFQWLTAKTKKSTPAIK